MKDYKTFLSSSTRRRQELDEIKNALDVNWSTSPKANMEAFEKEFMTYVGANDAVAVNSGTAALHLALILLNVGPKDTVFCSTFTFVASASPILYQGAKPVFIDSEPDSWNMSPLALRAAFRKASLEGRLPKAVIVVNIYGQSAMMDELLLICNYYNVPLIEDAAESLGTTYKGKSSGAMGTFGIYSFSYNKMISTGEGGMLVSQQSLDVARRLASHAPNRAPYMQHEIMGYNYRMSTILASIGSASLQQLYQRIDVKRQIFLNYYEALVDIPGISFMQELEDTRSNRWSTVMMIDEDKLGVSVGKVLIGLNKENMKARFLCKPLHLQPLFKHALYYAHKERMNIAEHLFVRGVHLPSEVNLRLDEQQDIIHKIKALLEKNRKKHLYTLGDMG